MTTTPPPDLAALAARVEELRAHVLTTDDGEEARVCHVDGYPSTMACTCGCAHNRHVGGTPENIQCMGYVGLPHCTCTRFVPAPADVAQLWQMYRAMVLRLDVAQLAAYAPHMLPRAWRERFAAKVIERLVEIP
jgi:hypothetical protein